VSLVEDLDIDCFNSSPAKFLVSTIATFSGNKSMVACNNNRLNETICCDAGGKVINISKVGSDSISDLN